MTLRHRALAAVLLLGCSLAQAQWAWKDQNNRPVYSDQPPPASVPASRIFKAPRGQMPDLRQELNASPAPPPVVPAKPATAPLAERNADYEKRRVAAAEAAAKAAVDQQNAAARAANCATARANQRALDAGGRISRFDEQGQAAFLTDAQRADEARRNAAAIAQHCR